MNKKRILLLFILLSSCGNSSEPAKASCPFCDPAVLERQAFYQDDLVLALYSYKPAVPGHCLIIPRRHVKRFEELTDAEIAHLGSVIKKVHSAVTSVFATNPYLLLEKNGSEVGQTVPHVHIHYIPRKPGDDSTITFLYHFLFAHLQHPLSAEELHQVTQQLHDAILKQTPESKER